jgi:hypothetical protein
MGGNPFRGDVNENFLVLCAGHPVYKKEPLDRSKRSKLQQGSASF